MPSFLLGVSLSSWNRVLGRTLTLAHGEASGFFYVSITGLFSHDFCIVIGNIKHLFGGQTMEFKIECPWCNQHYSVDESFAGQKVECSVCKKDFSVKIPNLSATQDNTKATDYFSGYFSKQKKINKPNDSLKHNQEKTECVSKSKFRTIIVAISVLVIVLISLSVIYCTQVLPEKEYQRGLKAYSEQRFEEALESFQKAADHGHVKAKEEHLVTLAEINYIQGSKAFKQQRYDDATEYYKKAEELGHAKAQKEQQKVLAEINYIKGEKAYKEQHYDDAIEYYKKAEELGHTRASSGYAEAQKKQQGILSQNNLRAAKKAIDEHRFEEAVNLLQQPATLGNSEAQFLLGTCYYNGEGIKRDVDEAARWFRKAAEQGDIDAQYKLGLSYLSGSGVAYREDEAVYWLQKAGEQGHPKAQLTLGDLYYKEGNNHNMSKAFDWYQKAGELAVASRANELVMCALFSKAYDGDAESQFAISGMYYDGKNGLTQNDNEGLKWLLKSANSGYPEAQSVLGAMTVLGRGGIKKNIAEGVKWLEKAANQGNAKAQYSLGLYYFSDGQYKKAIPLFRDAAENGNVDAMEKLYDIYNEGDVVKRNWSEAVKWLKEAEKAKRKEYYE